MPLSHPEPPLPEVIASPSGIPIDWGKYDDIRIALLGENRTGEINTRWILTHLGKSLDLDDKAGSISVSLGGTFKKLGIVRHEIVRDQEPRHVQTLRRSGVNFILALHDTGSVNFYDIDVRINAFDGHICPRSFGGPYILLYSKKEATGIGKMMFNMRNFLSGILDSE